MPLEDGPLPSSMPNLLLAHLIGCAGKLPLLASDSVLCCFHTVTSVPLGPFVLLIAVFFKKPLIGTTLCLLLGSTPTMSLSIACVGWLICLVFSKASTSFVGVMGVASLVKTPTLYAVGLSFISPLLKVTINCLLRRLAPPYGSTRLTTSLFLTVLMIIGVALLEVLRSTRLNLVNFFKKIKASNLGFQPAQIRAVLLADSKTCTKLLKELETTATKLSDLGLLPSLFLPPLPLLLLLLPLRSLTTLRSGRQWVSVIRLP